MTTAPASDWQEGGCRCGRLRYRVDLAGAIIDYCHCGQCRHWSGTPVLAWAQVSPDRFVQLAGEPKYYRSSVHNRRGFCPHCGTPLFMRDDGDLTIGITLGSLDHPEHAQPKAHGWTSAACGWLVIRDDLPRYAEDPPYDR